MSTTIYLGAVLVRDGLIHLAPDEQGQWVLPGGPLRPEHDDIDSAMDEILTSFGVEAPAVEDDFVETVYLRDGDTVTVFNLYAPTEWKGEPRTGKWVQPEELESAGLEPAVRDAVLATLGLVERTDDIPDLFHSLGIQAESTPDAMDVLRTLSGGDAAQALAGLNLRYGELAADIVDYALPVWTGEALDRRTRSLEVVAMVAALGGRPSALRSHLNGALNHGASPEEIVETLRMVAVYGGYPAALEAWPVMEEVFAARGIPRGSAS